MPNSYVLTIYVCFICHTASYPLLFNSMRYHHNHCNTYNSLYHLPAGYYLRYNWLCHRLYNMHGFFYCGFITNNNRMYLLYLRNVVWGDIMYHWLASWGHNVFYMLGIIAYVRLGRYSYNLWCDMLFNSYNRMDYWMYSMRYRMDTYCSWCIHRDTSCFTGSHPYAYLSFNGNTAMF